MNRTLPQLNRIIVKIGSSSLCDPHGEIDKRQVLEIARQVSILVRGGMEVVLISSGAVAAGLSRLNENTSTLENKQAAAAVGQPILMATFQQYFQAYDLNVAQVLLTHDDFQDRRRYLNARNTVNYLLGQAIIPIINENDTISTKEIRFSDNDFLGALCTNLVSADLFIILSNIDGIAEQDPIQHPDARIFKLLSIHELQELQDKFVANKASSIGRGGISTKLEAPLMAARYGVPSIIANSRTDDVLLRLLKGESLGSYVEPLETRLNSWRAFIAHALKPKALLTIDEGAANAILSSKASLLASGILEIQGGFLRGDAVRCCRSDGTEILRGIVEYNHNELSLIIGRQSAEIESILGYKHRRGVIHRENLVIL